MFVDIKDGEESSQVNCQNSNAADEARDRTPIAQLELHWRATGSVRQELQVGKQVTSFTGCTFGSGTGLGGYY